MRIESKIASQSGASSSSEYFLITSTGACATQWLGATLTKHPQMVCSSGARELNSSLNYEGASPKRVIADEVNGTADYLKKHFLDPSVGSRTLDSLFDELEQAQKAKYYGNVHHETIGTLHNNLQRHGADLRRSIRVANLIRHPIPRTAAKARIIQAHQAESEGMTEVYRMQFKTRVGRIPAGKSEIELEISIAADQSPRRFSPRFQSTGYVGKYEEELNEPTLNIDVVKPKS